MAVKQTAGKEILGEFASEFAHLNDDILFGEVWNRTDKLSLKERSLITIISLLAMGLTDSSFKYHLENGKKNGIKKEEIAEAMTHASFYIGWSKAWAGLKMAKEVWSEKEEEDDTLENYASSLMFPLGNPNDAYAKYFTGKSYLATISDKQVCIHNVTFDKGCRNNWHIHSSKEGGGQILICVGGKGIYQEWGKEPILMKEGDCVNIKPGIKHFHGACKDSYFSHLAIEVPGIETDNQWLEKVSDEEYDAALAKLKQR